MKGDIEDQLRDMRRDLHQLQRQVERIMLMQRAQTSTLMSVDEAAAFTGYAKAYLYKLTGRGEIPCYRPTKRRVFIEREEIERWIRRASCPVKN